jgi:hypothetical protein
MITVIFPHKTYSENKIKIKQIIKKYGMSWDDKRSGWVNEATGDGVYIDKSVIEMIMEDSFSADQPMTLFVESGDQDFIREFETKCNALGGQVIHGAATAVRPAAPGPTPAKKGPELPEGQKDILVRLGIRDVTGSNTAGFKEKAMADLKNISGRWERRKKQLLAEYSKMGLEKGIAEDMLRREEIAFRKNNACWVTGEFPADSKRHAD